MGHMFKTSDIQRNGNDITMSVASELVESLKGNPKFMESVQFQEDNTMSNSPELYTTTLAKFIYYKSYNDFAKYFDNIWMLTPADLGMPEGSGAYKIPKIMGATAAKLSSGEVVEYLNKNKSEVTLETDTYGIGTRINRRLRRRGARGFIEKLMTAASDSVLRALATDIANGMVAGAATANTVAAGISVDAIADAIKNLESAKDSNNILFGFKRKVLALTTVGKNVLTKSSDYKTIFGYGQNNIPGTELKTQYPIYDGMKVVEFELVTATKASKVVHGIVYDDAHFLTALRETEMDVFDGRIPGTAGDIEIIHAMDFGYVIMNAEAGAVITAA